MNDKTIQESRQRDAGFSLLEMLIALGILSLTSLALFQSMGSLLSVSEKASEASIRVAENTLSRESFSQIVAGLVPGWDERPDTIFQGGEDYFTGLTASAPLKFEDKLSLFAIQILSDETTGRENLTLRTLDNAIVLKEIQGSEAFFRYLGEDQVWYKQWPPQTVPSPGFFNDAELMDMPKTPVAIRLFVRPENDASRTTKQSWTAFIETRPELPIKVETGNDI